MPTIRWGILSTARINRRVIPAIRMSERGELVAVASRDLARAEEYAAEWEIPQTFGSYEAMLGSGEVDAVYISLPNHLHAEWTVKALEAGVNVLCEKPFALTLADVDRMIAAADQTGRVLAEAFMYRHHPQTKLLGEWVHGGKLGEVLAVRGTFNFPISDRSNIRLNKAFGGGSLWDVGIYPMSLAQFAFGSPPEYVTAGQVVGDTGVDELFAGQLHYPGGGMAQIISSLRSPFYTTAEVIGSQGRLYLNKPFVGVQEDGKMTFYPGNGGPQEIAVPDEYLYLGEIEDMHSAILDGTTPYLTLAETRDHVKTLLALYQAADEKRPVSLADIEGDQ